MRRITLLSTVALTLALALPAPSARADDLFFDWGRERILPKELDLNVPATPNNPILSRPNAVRLFRMMPGFLADPVGLQEDTAPPDPVDFVKNDDGLNWLQVAVGSDNPFFDVRRPGDPGGVGYYRMHTQLQLLDSPSTGCALGFQAVTPAGRDQGGLDDGPTVISPAFALFHALEDGTAFHGFVGKHVHLSNPSAFADALATPGRLHRSLHYGMAVQRPVAPEVDNVYLFVEALGRYRYDAAATGPPAVWEVLPGMHWKLTDSWWLSGAVVLPVNRDRPIDAKLWQITCSFQF